MEPGSLQAFDLRRLGGTLFRQVVEEPGIDPTPMIQRLDDLEGVVAPAGFGVHDIGDLRVSVQPEELLEFLNLERFLEEGDQPLVFSALGCHRRTGSRMLETG
jgi:hypothetical protein